MENIEHIIEDGGMNWRIPLIFAGLYLTESKNHKYLEGIKEKPSQEEIKINRGNIEANLIFLKKTGLLTKDKKNLEIGSGKGALVSYLSKEGYDITGTEINEEYINFAKNYFGVILEKMSGENLEFEDNSFDIVLSFDVFEHIPNVDAHLSEVRRVLKPGGFYLFQTPNKITNMPFEIIKNRSLTKHKTYHCSLQTFWSLKRLLATNNFEFELVKIPVMNEFLEQKIEKVFGRAGVYLLRMVNPDRLPMPLRTNFYVWSRKR